MSQRRSSKPLRVVALVPAAGSGSRYGGDKLQAILAGRPVLDHVLDALADVPIETIVVVTRPDRAIESRDRAGLIAVVNPSPERGLSSSLQTGLAAIEREAGPGVDAILVALGDQPLLDPMVVRRLIAAVGSTIRPVLVPRFGDPSGRNPVLLLRPAFGLLATATGDRGLGPILDAAADLVEVVEVGSPGNPDIDTPSDLARLEADARRRVRR